MRNILKKEMRLSASILTYLFIPFGLMFLLPGYPILCGAFFVTLGIFHSFQSAREANDTVFSALLPIAKRDIVKGKYLFVCLVEAGAFMLMALSAALRETVFSEAGTYKANALMNANGFALGMALVIFGLFNLIFVGGFFNTAYEFAKPFVAFVIACFLLIFVSEALHHVPGLERLNASCTEEMLLQMLLLATEIIICFLLTAASYAGACRKFENIDL